MAPAQPAFAGRSVQQSDLRRCLRLRRPADRSAASQSRTAGHRAAAALAAAAIWRASAPRLTATGVSGWNGRNTKSTRPAAVTPASSPENRLVARTLEQDWEKALSEQARLAAEHERFTRERPKAPT